MSDDDELERPRRPFVAPKQQKARGKTKKPSKAKPEVRRASQEAKPAVRRTISPESKAAPSARRASSRPASSRPASSRPAISGPVESAPEKRRVSTRPAADAPEKRRASARPASSEGDAGRATTSAPDARRTSSRSAASEPPRRKSTRPERPAPERESTADVSKPRRASARPARIDDRVIAPKPAPPVPEPANEAPTPTERVARPSVRRSTLPLPPAIPNADTRAPRSTPQPAPPVRLEPSSPGTLAAPRPERVRPAARATLPLRASQPPLAGAEEEAATVESIPATPDAAIASPDPSPLPQPEPNPDPDRDSVEDDLYAIEQTLDRFLDDAASTDDRAARRRAVEAFAQVAAHLGGTTDTPDAPGLARELLRPGYYVRQWGRLGLRDRSDDIDELGLDRTYETRFLPLFDRIYRSWFRVLARGLDHVPESGRCLVVANHGGALPWDGLMLRTAMRLDHPSRRELRWLAEDFVAHAPFLGAFVNRVGAVRACPENAERMLARDMLVAVFPEGEKGLGKPFGKRYELQRFGRGGYVKLALRTRTPIVPTAIVGSEEAHPLLFRTGALARLVGLPFLPITPTFPWLGPVGLVPLPSRWVILCGEPIHLDDADPDDPIAVAHLNDRVRGAVQDLVRRALDLRERPF
ncbi:lysophospholipid acyltransferase family protein [Sandaracinus amylolyticus]|uniref:Acyltransferase n=1 Tax=Sandaracinus amylolyticus TaxID=927083 RepID=A0A0F6YHN6_9BACT|nr:lysophospholipid acyltransferase family protein [Sandaracinus amylolyticus]AKF06001.1 acyltransferase [Sandaracinus amylolyticus]